MGWDMSLYTCRNDYCIIGSMMAGLCHMFMHTVTKSSAVFQPLGIGMLVVSLLCDGQYNINMGGGALDQSLQILVCFEEFSGQWVTNCC